MKFFSHRLLKHIFLLTAAVMILSVMIPPEDTDAKRYHDDEELASGDFRICVQNHLQEDCWYREGSFMYYTQEGFTSHIGVDVSKWNGDVDFEALKDQGVEFVIIRMGYRGYETGELVEDERFYEYMDAASDAGLDIGIYFYSQAIDEDEAIEEALFVTDHIAGYTINMPVYFDTEDVRQGESRTDIMATANYNMNALAFCKAVESEGYRAGIYASQDWIRKNLDLVQLADYEIWYASYNPTPGREPGFDMWQYTDMGDLNGCSTFLDMNVRVEKLS